MEEVQMFLDDAAEQMHKAIDHLTMALSKIRAGKATPSMLDSIRVDYYGQQSPLNQVSSVTTPDPHSIFIKPWEKNLIGDIEKEIQKSDLGLTPINDGTFIRLAIPVLTEERRLELVKLVKKYAEDARIAIRNIRRDANDQIKRDEKEKNISEDDSKKDQTQCQKITDQHIEKIEEILKQKEAEIMEV